MNYEQKYKEAIYLLKELRPKISDYYREKLDDLFPEIIESEDERIRKVLIGWINLEPSISFSDSFDGFSKEQIIAWLEKQGEQRPQGKLVLEVWKDMRLEVYQQASGNRHEPNYSDDSTKMFSLTDIDEIIEKVAEKQCEQKTTNKIKSRFKVGDWIVSARGTARIIGIGANDSDFLLEYIDGDQESLSVEYINSTYNKWNIQKAWEGDVLVCGDDKRPFIFKGLLDQNHPNCPVAYCGIDSGHNFIASRDDSWWTSREVKPATKEQQDYLFQKMGEAGYMWEGHTKKLVCK